MCTSVCDCMCESECMLEYAYGCFVMSECDVSVCVVCIHISLSMLLYVSLCMCERAGFSV